MTDEQLTYFKGYMMGSILMGMAVALIFVTKMKDYEPNQVEDYNISFTTEDQELPPKDIYYHDGTNDYRYVIEEELGK